MSSENNKCVYLHVDGEYIVRYVGSGTEHRAYITCANSDRGERYKLFVETNGKLEVKIVANGLTKVQAEDLERELFDKYIETALNHRRPNSAKEVTKEIFDEHLYYSESSKSCLRWKTDRVVGNYGSVKMKADSEAGSLTSTGYYAIKLKGKNYQAHRIVCVLHGFEIDGFVIDHLDHNRANNKISNLRVVSQKENNQNSSIRSDNTSGTQGVKYHKRHDQWVATWYEDGEQKFKHFPIKNFASSEEALQFAAEYRKRMVELHYN